MTPTAQKYLRISLVLGAVVASIFIATSKSTPPGAAIGTTSQPFLKALNALAQDSSTQPVLSKYVGQLDSSGIFKYNSAFQNANLRYVNTYEDRAWIAINAALQSGGQPVAEKLEAEGFVLQPIASVEDGKITYVIQQPAYRPRFHAAGMGISNP